MNKKNIPVVNVGISLLILIFMTLSLLAFSVLSLENAVADRRLSRKMAIWKRLSASSFRCRGREAGEPGIYPVSPVFLFHKCKNERILHGVQSERNMI